MKRLRVTAARALRLTVVRHGLAALAGLALVLVVSAVLPSYRNFQLAELSYLVCATAGLTFLAGPGGQISVGQGAFMAIGAYTTALVINHQHWNLAAALLSALVVAACVGLLLGLATARLRGLYLATLTLALAVALPALVNVRGLSGILEGSNGLSVLASPPPAVLGADFSTPRWQAWVTGFCAVVTLWFLANLGRSRYGRSMRAARDDEAAAALSGVNVARVRLLAFVVAAACGGLGGGLLAWVTSLASPGAFSLNLSFGLLAAAILGGLGSLAGAVWGSLLLVVVSSVTSDLSSGSRLPIDVANNLPGAVYGVVLIVVMMTFPGGLHQGYRWISSRIPALVRRSRPPGDGAGRGSGR
ncbi:branched-chain amino acid ABC transporter permease [Kitasatospora sp. NPDC048540]|uniref:branched-chain amino acid ABC transporter permease n=1 Tax=unclassified Kitasatospora TaxID=2633591 RepID=UPI000A6826D8|nr:branched-chain amino acid ABC transporter permease [Kitasatospora sp. MBT63]